MKYATAKVTFEMVFEDNFTNEQMENCIRYLIGDSFELYPEDNITEELSPRYVHINIERN